jgi:hypothetical protein
MVAASVEVTAMGKDITAMGMPAVPNSPYQMSSLMSPAGMDNNKACRLVAIVKDTSIGSLGATMRDISAE